MTQTTPNQGSFYGPYAVGDGYVLYVYTKFEADSSIRSKVIRGPKIWKLGHVIPATPTCGSFYNPYAGRVSVLCRYQI